MLELENVYSYYGSSPVLQALSLSVGEGQLVSVLGRNGVGKTTLMKTIMGLTDRMTGSLRFDGGEMRRMPTFQRALRGVAYIPQGREIVGRFTVGENLTMGTFARADGSREVPDFIFELFPVLREMIGRRGGDLSGGQQQQLAIGRALAMSPRMLLLDEPTEGIQPNIVEEIEDVIMRLNREFGITVILVEQNVRFARRASDRYVLIDKGRIASQGEISALTDELVQQHMTV